MRILTCYFPPTSGNAKVCGYDVFTESLKVREKVGYMPERVPLYQNMTVEEYISFVADIKKVPSDKKEDRLEYVYTRCGLEDVTGKLIRKLSKGYRQRVGLAQALVHDPEVLILDEPTSGLDPKQIREVRDLIQGFKGERTIILSTHILPEVSQVCSRVVIINKGKLIAIDTPANLSERFDKMRGYREISLKVREQNKQDVTDVIKSVKGVTGISLEKDCGETGEYMLKTEVNDSIPECISSVITEKKWGLLSIAPVHMSLEDVFLKLTEKEEEKDENKKEVELKEKKDKEGGEQ
jgi:ABC-2 type transport system ATP-binding protein